VARPVLYADALRRHAFPLPGRPASALVPEPAVKDILDEMGVAVPARCVASAPGLLADAAGRLRAPLVLKAWGPGIVHKSDLGAVRLGLDHAALLDAATEMAGRLSSAGITHEGFLVEEQAAAGVELLVGVANRPPWGHVLMVGSGGTATEIYGDVVTRLCPIGRSDAEEMLSGFQGARLLDGQPGQRGADRGSLVELLERLAGPDGLVSRIGPALAEFECNPVIATPVGSIVADARLIISYEASTAPSFVPPADPVDFAKLFRPKSIAVAGASSSRETFGNWALAAYRDFGWTEGLYAIHPNALSVDGVPAYPSVADIPGGVDYLLAAVPAAACPDLVREAAGHAGIVQIVSGGFGETGADGRELEDALLRAARDARVRVVGPNCMGTYSPAGRQTFQLDAPTEAGPVGIVSQSGGLAGDMVKLGAKRGICFSNLVSAGNAIDVGLGELIEGLISDPDTRVIGLYLEGPRDGARVIEAFRRAQGEKPTVALIGGMSRQGQRAVASHTGSMTSDCRLWDAIEAATGVVTVASLDDLLGSLLFLQRYLNQPVPADPAVMVVGVGGGASVLAADACDRAGLELPPLDSGLVEQLRGMGFGVGMSLVNPLEVGIGPKTEPGVFSQVLDVVLADQPVSDVLLHVNVQSYYSYGTSGIDRLLATLGDLGDTSWPNVRLALVARNNEAAPGAEIDLLYAAARDARVPLYRTFDEAATAIAVGKRLLRWDNRTNQTLE
jgi:acyl-CoA synthetase (NDP forming)